MRDRVRTNNDLHYRNLEAAGRTVPSFVKGMSMLGNAAQRALQPLCCKPRNQNLYGRAE